MEPFPDLASEVSRTLCELEDSRQATDNYEVIRDRLYRIVWPCERARVPFLEWLVELDRVMGRPQSDTPMTREELMKWARLFYYWKTGRQAPCWDADGKLIEPEGWEPSRENSQS